MRTIIILLYFLFQAICLDLYLPFNGPGEGPFEIEITECDCPNFLITKGIAFRSKCVVAKNYQVINRVIYNGYLLYDDKEGNRDGVGHIVGYDEFRGRVYVFVMEKLSLRYVSYQYIANDVVYDLMKVKTLIYCPQGTIDGLTPGLFLTYKYPSLHDEHGPYKGLNITKNMQGITHSTVRALGLTIRHDVDKIFENHILGKKEPYDPIFDLDYVNVNENK